MQSISDLINKKAKQLVVDGKKTELDIAQQELERFYKSGAKAVKIYQDGNLLIEVKSSSMASSIFMQQHKIMKSVNSIMPQKISGIRTKVV